MNQKPTYYRLHDLVRLYDLATPLALHVSDEGDCFTVRRGEVVLAVGNAPTVTAFLLGFREGHVDEQRGSRLPVRALRHD